MSDVADVGDVASTVLVPGVTVKGAIRPGYERVLSPEALTFVADMERRFGAGCSPTSCRRPRTCGVGNGACPHQHPI